MRIKKLLDAAISALAGALIGIFFSFRLLKIAFIFSHVQLVSGAHSCHTMHIQQEYKPKVFFFGWSSSCLLLDPKEARHIHFNTNGCLYPKKFQHSSSLPKHCYSIRNCSSFW